MTNLKRFIYSKNITIRITQLKGCRGMAVKNCSGYVVLVSDTLSAREQRRTAMHELLHIKLGHLDDKKDLPNTAKEKEVSEAIEEWRRKSAVLF